MTEHEDELRRAMIDLMVLEEEVKDLRRTVENAYLEGFTMAAALRPYGEEIDPTAERAWTYSRAKWKITE
jgi:hypothetical protein